ncbi:MAG TPA: T9SS type A sorting domain-containing protein [Ignavibacteria bacterium]|nr:T9SS type A sorting domain-containing protein [Ignavibacteria bacterium]
MRKILYIIPLFIFSFTFTGGPPSGWYQQFVPDVEGRQIVDMTFTDSLTGYIITSRLSLTDSSYVLKTTNGGDNWNVNNVDSGFIYKKIQFIDQNTGYIGGTHLIKTTNGGNNWFTISTFLYMEDLFASNEDTMWYAKGESLTGGVFRTTNGGINWTQQLNLGSLNPARIYMYNSSTGYISNNSGTYLRRTTNSGVNWEVIPGENGFSDIEFIDDNTGWKAYGNMKKTTNGGLNWTTQILPDGGPIIVTTMDKFSVINSDTIWGVGGYASTSLGARGILYRTTNGGENWYYQIPDSNINIFKYYHIQFTDNKKGWAYSPSTGIHTKIGGDSTFTNIHQLSSEIPSEYILYQNYPNPFNPTTNINYELRIKSKVKLTIYDISGRTVQVLVNHLQAPGMYQYTFNGADITSGIYFYKLETENYTDTKKMMLVK